MDELNNKIDELIELLNSDNRIIKLEELKNKLLSDKDFISKIGKLKDLDIYSKEYLDLKKELFENSEFVSFKELENEINYLIMEINSKLNTLTNERRCKHENN